MMANNARTERTEFPLPTTALGPEPAEADYPARDVFLAEHAAWEREKSERAERKKERAKALARLRDSVSSGVGHVAGSSRAARQTARKASEPGVSGASRQQPSGAATQRRRGSAARRAGQAVDARACADRGVPLPALRHPLPDRRRARARAQLRKPSGGSRRGGRSRRT